jgi:dihydrofolate reductase
MEAIYAIDLNNGISKNCVIPWYSNKDLTFFANKTKNSVVIMGRATYFSLPDNVKHLKNRLNIVLTSKPEQFLDLQDGIENVIFTNNDKIHNAILNYREKYLKKYPFLSSNFKIFFIGGKKIYEQYIPLCEKVWVTQIKKDYLCDLIMDYPLKDSKQFTETEIIEEDEELKIILYEKIN